MSRVGERRTVAMLPRCCPERGDGGIRVGKLLLLLANPGRSKRSIAGCSGAGAP